MPWGPASPAYFDMSGVFTMNGITPHNTFKPHNTRYNPRHRYIININNYTNMYHLLS